MPKEKFRSVIKLSGINPYVIVEAALAERLKPKWRKPMPVIARLDGHPRQGWHINLMPVGDGSFYLYLNGDVRREAAAEVGDDVEIELSFDSSYEGGPAGPMPPWFRDALAKSAPARRSFEALPPSRQKEILRYFAGLKSVDAQKRNLAKALHVLSGRPGRFMARDWNT
jgi:hypothetical protein